MQRLGLSVLFTEQNSRVVMRIIPWIERNKVTSQVLSDLDGVFSVQMCLHSSGLELLLR